LIFFNVSAALNYLTLESATSSVEGDNTRSWYLGHYGYDRATVNFGEFDYSLRTASGSPASSRIAPGETQSFTFSASCLDYAGCASDVLDGWSEGGYWQARAALHFAYGPGGRRRVRRVHLPRRGARACVGCAVRARPGWTR
jgi:hypothetical protein